MASLSTKFDEFFEIQVEDVKDPTMMSFTIRLRPVCYDIAQMDRDQLHRLLNLLDLEMVEDRRGMVQNPMTGDWSWL